MAAPTKAAKPNVHQRLRDSGKAGFDGTPVWFPQFSDFGYFGRFGYFGQFVLRQGPGSVADQAEARAPA